MLLTSQQWKADGPRTVDITEAIQIIVITHISIGRCRSISERIMNSRGRSPLRPSRACGTSLPG